MGKILLDILDDDAELTGEAGDIFDVHKRGLWHRSSHLWIVNSKKQILLQRRSPHIFNNPNLWDISVGGHVDAGENSLSTVIREAKEEIGLQILQNELLHIGTLKNDSEDTILPFVNKEFNDIFLLIRDISIEDLVLDKNEVSEVLFVDIEKFKERVEMRDVTLVSHWSEYKFLIDYLDTH